MPGGIQLFANALKVSEKELFGMMERGEVLAKDVLPLVAKEMSKVANAGGALEAKMLTTRVQQGRFFKELETSMNLVFTSGFDEGLAGLFKGLVDELKDSRHGLKGLGEAFKTFFGAIGFGMSIVSPIIESFFYVLGEISKMASAVADVLGNKLTFALALLLPFLSSTVRSLKVLRIVAGSILWPILGVIAAFDELFSLFTDGRVGLIEKFLGLDFSLNLSDLFTGVIDWDKFYEGFGEAFSKAWSKLELSKKISDSLEGINWLKMLKGLLTGLFNILTGVLRNTLGGKLFSSYMGTIEDNSSPEQSRGGKAIGDWWEGLGNDMQPTMPVASLPSSGMTSTSKTVNNTIDAKLEVTMTGGDEQSKKEFTNILENFWTTQLEKAIVVGN